MMPGDIVSCNGPLGRGSVQAVGDDLITVSHFIHPGADGEIVETYSPAMVRRTHLMPETRAYVQLEGNLIPGRVLDHFPDDRRCIVRVSGAERVLPEAAVRVRANAPITDASRFLQHRVIESRRFHASRSMFVREYLERARAYRGVTSLASSSIDLVPHQIETARQVLSDPVQRYILADEVGMGKTIEAGLIIRQHLLDSTGTVLVVSPDALCAQWTEELAGRFHTESDFPGRCAIRTATEAMRGSSASHSLLVVDEAHDVLSDEGFYSWIERAAVAARGVLLLTATPPLDDPEAMLRMMRLLQPHMTDQDQRLAWLREAQDQRGRIADALRFIRPGNMQGTIQRGLDLLLETTDDDHIRQAVAEISEHDLRDGDAHVEPLLDLSAYVTETHRLLARAIRERRNGVLGMRMPVVGRQRPTVVLLEEHADRHWAVDAYVDSIALLEAPIEVVNSEAMSLIRSHLDALMTPMLTPRAEAQSEAPEHIDIHNAYADVLELSGQGEQAARLGEVGRLALEAVNENANVVILTHSQQAATDVFAELMARCRLRQRDVIRRLSDEDPRAALWFKERGDSGLDGSILVVDELGEVGQNLQRATMVIHAGLIIDPVRWEQRIGRFDRYGDAEVQEHVVVLGRSRFEAEWLDLLTEGFGLFDESRATLQSPMARLSNACLHDALVQGADGLCARWQAIVTTELADELERVEREEALALGSTATHQSDLYESVSRAEEAPSTDRWRDALLQWSSGAVQPDLANLRFMKWEEPGHLVTIAASTRHPPLIALDRLVEFSGALDEGRTTGTFERFWATRDHKRIFNPGHPFVEALLAFSREDDRGRTFAQLRSRPSLADLPDRACLLFDFYIEPDLSAAAATLEAAGTTHLETASLRRFAAAYFAPCFKSVWLSSDGGVVTAPDELALLNAPIDSNVFPGQFKRDATIRIDDWYRVDEALHGERWENVFERVRGAAAQWLGNDNDLAVAITTGAEALERVSLEQCRRMVARKEPGATEAATNWANLTEAIRSGIETPTIGVDACGLVVLSGIPLGDAP